MPIDLICLDADDTLWHNMRFFQAAEDALLAMLQPIAAAGVARETLRDAEARNLRIYGYGVKGFTLSMIETAVELCGAALSADTVSRILTAGRALLEHPVELLPGVEATVAALAARARLVLVTKGDLLHQEAKIAASGLGSSFAGIEIVSDKTPDTFRRLCHRHDVPAERVLMAGDSLRSDIRPALEAGAWAVFVPHAIAWSHEAAEEPVSHPRFLRARSIADLPAIVDAIG